MKKNKIIDDVFLGFEKNIKQYFSTEIKIPIIKKIGGWDIQADFHYSEENGLNKLIRHEGSEVSKIIKSGGRIFIIFEYYRKPAPNLPEREIYMGEIISVDTDIHIVGCCKNFATYVNE